MTRKIDHSSLANPAIYRDEIADVLVDVLLHGVAPIDAGADLAEHLVPGAPQLRAQIASQRRQILVEAQAGIEVPASELRRFSDEYHTFCVQRFYRSGARRRFYASAMALLRKDQSEGTSYRELGEFLHTRGAKDHIASDLEQLFRRVVFNVLIGNRDDHLRNHGFLLTPTGWRLAPAFDLNPNTDRADHVLNIDESDNRPSLATVIETSEWYVEGQRSGHIGPSSLKC